MTPAFFKRSAPLLVALIFMPLSARAALVADPAVLYKQMKDAYAKGSTDG